MTMVPDVDIYSTNQALAPDTLILAHSQVDEMDWAEPVWSSNTE